MGQAPRQSITDFLSNLGETYNIPNEEGEIFKRNYTFIGIDKFFVCLG